MEDVGWWQVTQALAAAVAEREDVTILAQPDLDGAIAIGSRAEVYLVPTALGMSVECWRSSDADPYKIVLAGGLDEAVRVAVDEL